MASQKRPKGRRGRRRKRQPKASGKNAESDRFSMLLSRIGSWTANSTYSQLTKRAVGVEAALALMYVATIPLAVLAPIAQSVLVAWAFSVGWKLKQDAVRRNVLAEHGETVVEVWLCVVAVCSVVSIAHFNFLASYGEDAAIATFKGEAYASESITIGDHRPDNVSLGHGCALESPCINIRIAERSEYDLSVIVGGIVTEGTTKMYAQAGIDFRMSRQTNCWMELEWRKYRARLLIEDGHPSHTRVWIGKLDGYRDPDALGSNTACGLEKMVKRLGLKP